MWRYASSQKAFTPLSGYGIASKNPAYTTWEQDKIAAQQADTKATREIPKGQKEPAVSAGRPKGKRSGKKGKKKGKKDDE